MAEGARRNLPPLSLHVPEPKFRPGDAVDYADFDKGEAGAVSRPPKKHKGRDLEWFG